MNAFITLLVVFLAGVILGGFFALWIYEYLFRPDEHL